MEKITRIEFNIDEVLFLCWYSVFYLGDSIFQMIPTVIYIGGYLAIGVFALFFKKVQAQNKNILNKCIFFCIFVSAFHLISIIYNGNAEFVEIIYTWGFMGIATLLFSGKIRVSVMKICLYGVFLHLTIMLFWGVDAQEVFRSSRNAISAQIIFILMLFYLVIYKKQRKIVFFPAIYAAFLCLWGEGRTGLVVSIAFIVLLFFYNWIFVKQKRIKTLVQLAACVLGCGIILHNVINVFYMNVIERFTIQGFETKRVEIWEQYFFLVRDSFSNFAFGAPTSDTEYTLIDYYDGNLHNSFLQLHSCYGLLVFLVIIICIFVCFYRAICSKEYFFCILLLIICLRAFFDWAAFPGNYEIIFYYFITTFLFTKKERIIQTDKDMI